MKSIGKLVGLFSLTLNVSVFILPSVAFGSTKVGNGGDIMAEFLEQMRFAIADVSFNVIKQGKIDLCNKVTRLNAEEQAYCNLKISELLPELLKLMESRPIVPLRIQEEEIFIELPGGTKRPVIAITNCGKDGPINFNFSGVKLLSPVSLFHLMAHEFFHKVPFEGADCLQDLDTPGPFSEFEGGRRLIDAMAESLQIYATSVGKIGRDMGITDSFNCTIRDPQDPFVHPHVANTTRLFSGEVTAGKYTAGVGLLPRDGNCALESSNLKYKISLNLKINENGNCKHQEQIGLRSTTVQLVKSYSSLDPNIPPQKSEVLDEKIYEGINPLCSWYVGDNIFSATLTLDGGRKWIYSLEYLYSKGSQMRELMKNLAWMRTKN
jgi:hypothetical protein